LDKVNLQQLVNEIKKLAASESYYWFLRYIIDYLRPPTIVEIGTHRGHSAMCMLSAIKKDGHLYTIDVADDFKCEHSQLTKIISFDLNVDLSKIPEIDLLFIDSTHKAEHVRKVLNKYIPHVKQNGIVLMDDIKLNDMYPVWMELTYPKMELNYLHQSGFGIFVKDKPWTSFGMDQA